MLSRSIAVLLLAVLVSATARAEFRTLRVHALAHPGLRSDATRLAHLTVSIVASEDDDSTVFLSVEETAVGKPAPNSDVKATIDTHYSMVRLSVVDLGACGEVVLLSYEVGNRVRFTIYGVGENATPVSLLSGTANNMPFGIPLFENGPVICVTNHETGNFSQYYLTLYAVRQGALKAIKAFAAEKQTAFALQRFVREVPVETIDDFHVPKRSPRTKQ